MVVDYGSELHRECEQTIERSGICSELLLVYILFPRTCAREPAGFSVYSSAPYQPIGVVVDKFLLQYRHSFNGRRRGRIWTLR